jgi:hypothetical protein
MSFWYLAQPEELLIDLDNYMRPAPSKTGESRGPWGEIFFRRRLADAIRAERLAVEMVFLDRSNTELHWHAIVRLARPMAVMERLAWQLRLGSDLMRAQADIMRAARGIESPSLLIRKTEMADFYRAPDRECPCTRKHDTAEQFELGAKACPVWLQYRGMTPYELFGPTFHGDQRGVALPIGNVPLQLILAINTQPKRCEFCGAPEPCIKDKCILAALAMVERESV